MQRRSRLLLFSLAASAPVIGMMVAAGPAAHASSAPSASARAHALAVARNYLRHLSIGQHATDHAVRVNHPGISGLTQVQSTNWAGYADDNTGGTSYTTVTPLDRAERDLHVHDLARGVLGRDRRLHQRLGGAGRHADRMLGWECLLFHV